MREEDAHVGFIGVALRRQLACGFCFERVGIQESNWCEEVQEEVSR